MILSEKMMARLLPETTRRHQFLNLNPSHGKRSGACLQLSGLDQIGKNLQLSQDVTGQLSK